MGDPRNAQAGPTRPWGVGLPLKRGEVRLQRRTNRTRRSGLGGRSRKNASRRCVTER
jgi:hypothetical protein